MKLVLLIALLLSCISGNAQNYTGCSSNGSSLPSQQYALYSSSGNNQLDQFIQTDVNVLRSFFGVNPSLFLYDDAGSPNARAFGLAQISQRPDGTVILGKNYITQMFQFAGNLTVIPVTVAHEFGHIVDYKYHVVGRQGMTAELFADFMAGAFLYYRSYQTATDIQSNLKWFVSIGDYGAINDPLHHGTPQQRLNSAMAGYNWLLNNSYPGVNVSNAIVGAKQYLGIP